MGKHVIIFGAYMSSSVHINDKNKDIGEGQTQELDDTTSTAEPKYFINFGQPRKGFVLLLTVFYLLMLQKCINSKQRTLK